MTTGQKSGLINQEELTVVEVNIKEVTYTSEEGTEVFYHSFYKEDGKVTVFSVMSNEKGK